MAIMMGGRYKLVRHPSQPVGIAKSSPERGKILVEWEDSSLIPPSDLYPEDSFSDGTFEFLGWKGEFQGAITSSCCSHDWKKYQGFREEYEFCTKCDTKR